WVREPSRARSRSSIARNISRMVSTFSFAAMVPSLDIWTSEYSRAGDGTTRKAHRGRRRRPRRAQLRARVATFPISPSEPSPFNRTPAALPLIEDAGAGEPKHGDAAEREDPRDVSSRDH